MNRLTPPILGKCAKCGREFIMLPGDGELIDRHGDPFREPPWPYQAGEWPECGGKIELTEAGRLTSETAGGGSE